MQVWHLWGFVGDLRQGLLGVILPKPRVKVLAKVYRLWRCCLEIMLGAH